MGLINWVFDFYQQYRIEKLHTSTAQAQAGVRSGGGGVDAERLDRAIAELALAMKTLQRVMIEKNVCTADDFREKLRQVDLEDGRADGRAL